MLYDSLQRYLIIKRCWKIYELVTDKFDVESNFHAEYPAMVENALLTGRLLVRVASLFIQEEYMTEENKLVVTDYSYILIDDRNQPLIRAEFIITTFLTRRIRQIERRRLIWHRN